MQEEFKMKSIYGRNLYIYMYVTIFVWLPTK